MLLELGALNRAYQKYLHAGGKLSGTARAEDVVKQISYLPFVEDKLFSRTVGPQTFKLLHAPGSGFVYAAEAGDTTEGVSILLSREDALQALFSLDRVVWSSDEYASRLMLLNEAYRAGNLQDGDMLQAGLIWYNDEWASFREVQLELAEEGWRQSRLGVDWSLWSPETQSAYANIYPSLALDLVGPRALDLMTDLALTRGVSRGYVRIAGQWEKPIFQSTRLNLSYRLDGNGSETLQPPLYVYVQDLNSPLQVPKYAGRLFSAVVLKWEGVAYYWQADLPQNATYRLFLAYDQVSGLRENVRYVTSISNGELDNNPWSGAYGRVLANSQQSMIISSTPPTEEHF